MRKFQQDMEAEVGNFQQHTEVRWLSIGSAIKRILEQQNVITKFIEGLAKDSDYAKECEFQESTCNASYKGKSSYLSLTRVFE